MSGIMGYYHITVELSWFRCFWIKEQDCSRSRGATGKWLQTFNRSGCRWYKSSSSSWVSMSYHSSGYDWPCSCFWYVRGENSKHKSIVSVTCFYWYPKELHVKHFFNGDMYDRLLMKFKKLVYRNLSPNPYLLNLVIHVVTYLLFVLSLWIQL